MGPQSEARRALILFAHGARDPRWAEPLARIQQMIALRTEGNVQVHQAFLELMQPTLPDLTAKLVAQAVTEIVVVPVFLGQGAHVRDDLPKLIAGLRAQYPDSDIKLVEAVGEQELVLRAIADFCLDCL